MRINMDLRVSVFMAMLCQALQLIHGQDVTSCADSPCKNEALCEDTITGYQCFCVDGFAGDNCEINFDDCGSGPCKNNGTCTDGVAGYSCSCSPGFTGQECEANIDECLSSPCLMDGTCIDLVNGYTCECPSPFRGGNCSLLPCDTVPCENEALCENDLTFNQSLTGYLCDCIPGFSGVRCEINLDDCDRENDTSCTGNGLCVDGINDYSCLCEPGWIGDFCQLPVNDCIGNDCRHGSSCVDEHLRYTCTCPDGYEGDLCERERDECTTWYPCQNEATCVDLFNDYSCECTSAWFGRNCAEEVNECLANRCENGGQCLDIVGGFVCRCPPFFRGELCETPYNPCSPDYNPCQNGANCIAPPDGKYVCFCKSGFTGANCEVNINECILFPCENNATCEDITAGYVCHCRLGWTGRHCGINIDECASQPCANGATCFDVLNGFHCNCTPEYTGRLCEEPVDYCLQTPCFNDGTCLRLIGDYQCHCLPPYTGRNCLDLLNECETSPCFNNATCINTDIGYECVCEAPFSGRTCDTITNYCASQPCLNGGSCRQLRDQWICICPIYLTGRQCTDLIDYCRDNPCLNGGVCINNEFGFRCLCLFGYTGNVCNQQIDFCNNDPCLNSANCSNVPGGFYCDCVSNYDGDLCESSVTFQPTPSMSTTLHFTTASLSSSSGIITKTDISSFGLSSKYGDSSMDTFKTSSVSISEISISDRTIIQSTESYVSSLTLQTHISDSLTSSYVTTSLITPTLIPPSTSDPESIVTSSDSFDFTSTSEKSVTIISSASTLVLEVSTLTSLSISDLESALTSTDSFGFTSTRVTSVTIHSSASTLISTITKMLSPTILTPPGIQSTMHTENLESSSVHDSTSMHNPSDSSTSTLMLSSVIPSTELFSSLVSETIVTTHVPSVSVSHDSDITVSTDRSTILGSSVESTMFSLASTNISNGSFTIHQTTDTVSSSTPSQVFTTNSFSDVSFNPSSGITTFPKSPTSMMTLTSMAPTTSIFSLTSGTSSDVTLDPSNTSVSVPVTSFFEDSLFTPISSSSVDTATSKLISEVTSSIVSTTGNILTTFTTHQISSDEFTRSPRVLLPSEQTTLMSEISLSQTSLGSSLILDNTPSTTHQDASSLSVISQVLTPKGITSSSIFETILDLSTVKSTPLFESYTSMHSFSITDIETLVGYTYSSVSTIVSFSLATSMSSSMFNKFTTSTDESQLSSTVNTLSSDSPGTVYTFETTEFTIYSTEYASSSSQELSSPLLSLNSNTYTSLSLETSRHLPTSVEYTSILPTSDHSLTTKPTVSPVSGSVSSDSLVLSADLSISERKMTSLLLPDTSLLMSTLLLDTSMFLTTGTISSIHFDTSMFLTEEMTSSVLLGTSIRVSERMTTTQTSTCSVLSEMSVDSHSSLVTSHDGDSPTFQSTSVILTDPPIHSPTLTPRTISPDTAIFPTPVSTNNPLESSISEATKIPSIIVSTVHEITVSSTSYTGASIIDSPVTTTLVTSSVMPTQVLSTFSTPLSIHPSITSIPMSSVLLPTPVPTTVVTSSTPTSSYTSETPTSSYTSDGDLSTKGTSINTFTTATPVISTTASSFTSTTASSVTTTTTAPPVTTTTTASSVTTTTTASPVTSTTASSVTTTTTTPIPLSCETFSCDNNGVCRQDVFGIFCDCVEGFIGTFCETETTACDGIQCENGGLCSVVMATYGQPVPYCNCPLPYSGRFCNQELLVYFPSFHGQSYMCFDSPGFSSTSMNEVYLSIKTTQSNGTVLFSSAQPNTESAIGDEYSFIQLYIEGGMIHYRFSCDGAIVGHVRTDQAVNTGDVYGIVIRQVWPSTAGDWCSSSLTINTRTFVSPPVLTIKTPQALRDLVLGGVLRHNFDADVLTSTDVVNGYVGCVRSLQINGAEIDMVTRTKAGLNIENCNVPVCQHNPCRNGATCHSFADDWYCACLTGYGGDLCETKLCENNPCHHGGSCIVMEKEKDTLCICPYGRGGPLCQQELKPAIPHFSGTVYELTSYVMYSDLHYITDNFEIEFDMVLEENSTDSNLILYMGNTGSDTGKDFFVVSLVGGYLLMRFDLGSGQGDIYSPEPLDLSLPTHRVTLGRVGRTGWLQVDGQDNVTGQSDGLLTALNVQSDLYVGGVDLAKLAIIPASATFGDGLKGCVYNLNFKTFHTAFTEPGSPPGHVSHGRNVRECSVISCDPNPCMNGAACIEIGASFFCNCTDGWKGVFCTDEITICDVNHTCASGSTCLPTSSGGYRCLCPLGKKGHHCDENVSISDAMFIGEESYMSFRPVYIKKTVDIQLEIKPSISDGLLFYVALRLHRNSGDFLSLVLREGFVELRYSLGSTLNVVRGDRKLDGKTDVWHRVHAGRNATHGYVSVDGNVTVAMTTGFMLYLDTTSDFYLGGLPALDDASPLAFEDDPVAFEGCIRALVVNGHTYDLTSRGALSGRNIDDCDGTECGQSTCKNGGRCHVTDDGAFNCTCSDGFYGDTCSLPMECKTHGCFHGNCVVDDPYRCDCHLGWVGEYCNLETDLGTSAAFKSTSYLTLEAPNDGDNNNVNTTQISLAFKTTSLHGLIFWSGQTYTDDEDYLGVGIFEGRVKLVWNLGWFSRTETMTTLRYNDDQWHSLQIQRLGQQMTLTMDDVTYESRVSGDFYQLDTGNEYYLGAFNESDVKENTLDNFKRAFVGCIKDFTVGRQTVLFSDALDGINIQQCPPD